MPDRATAVVVVAFAAVVMLALLVTVVRVR
jgi:hypothetical protein